MKINNKIFSIPPYISTCWNNVSALHMKGATLIVSIIDGDTIEIPGLDAATTENIFNTHANFLEQDGQEFISRPAHQMLPPFSDLLRPDQKIDTPFRLTISTLDELGSVLHHNSAQANSPDIPHQIPFGNFPY